MKKFPVHTPCIFCKQAGVDEDILISVTCECRSLAHIGCLNSYLARGDVICFKCETFINRDKLFLNHSNEMSIFKQKSFLTEISVNQILYLFERNNDKNILFYELVFKQCCFDIFRVVFSKLDAGKTIKVYFYPLYSRLSSKEMTEAYKIDSIDMHGNDMHYKSGTTRLLHDSENIECYINKIIFKSGVLGSSRFINTYNPTNDSSIFLIKFKNFIPYSESNLVKIKVSQQPFELNNAKEEVILGDEMDIESKENDRKYESDYFILTADFWHFTQCASNLELNMIDLKKILAYSRKENYNTESLACMASEFAKYVSRNLFYKNDEAFLMGSSGEVDCHDIKLEISSFGDCEDFTHFFLRIFNLMFCVCDYFFVKDTKLLKMWITLRNHYNPFAYICEIQTNKGKAYHSTFLLIPKKKSTNYKVISIEVTNPSATYDMNKAICDVSGRRRSFNEWHIRNFYVLSFLSLHKLEPPLDDISSLNVETLIKDPFFLF